LQGCVCRLCYCHRAFGFLRNRRPRLSGRDSDKKSCGSGFVATSTYGVVPAHVRGRLQAVRRTVAELGSGLAPLFGGYLANTFNPGVPFLFYAPLLAVSATLL